jgi:ATP-dependent Zn protease
MNNTANLNINDLKQLSQLIDTNESNQFAQQRTVPKIQKKVKIQTPPHSDSSEMSTQQVQTQVPQQKPDVQQTLPDQSVNISPNFELMGYVINKQTIYLLIVLILIGVGLWFATADKPKSNKKEKKVKDENEDEDDAHC